MMPAGLDPEAAAEFFAAYPAAWPLLAAAVGACMASFAGVLSDRLALCCGWNREPDPAASLWLPSRCDACGSRVGPLALVPVLGWLALRGRCAACRAPVPWRYPVAEAACAAASAAFAVRFGPAWASALTLAALWGAGALAWIDWREGWIPDRISAPLALAGLWASPFAEADERIRGLTLGAAAITAAFWFMSWRRGEDMFAGGDIMFCAMAGAWLGPQATAWFLVAASAAYSAHHGAMALAGARWMPADPDARKGMGDLRYVPMGPALALAFAGALWAAGP